MTTIRDLPVYGLDLACRNNEDFALTLPFTDSRIRSVTVYRGGSAIAPPGWAGALPYSGALPALFGAPASGAGRPALGVATVAAGVLTDVAISDRGCGYGRRETVPLTIPGAGPDVVVGVAVGVPLSLAGIDFDIEVRAGASSKLLPISASTLGTIRGLPTNGSATIHDAALFARWTEAVVAARLMTPGAYPIEVRAYADGFTRVVATGTLQVSQGVARERG